MKERKLRRLERLVHLLGEGSRELLEDLNLEEDPFLVEVVAQEGEDKVAVLLLGKQVYVLSPGRGCIPAPKRLFTAHRTGVVNLRVGRLKARKLPPATLWERLEREGIERVLEEWLS